MMWQYGNGTDGWGIGLMTVGSLLVWALTAVGVVVLIRHLNRGSAGPRPAVKDVLAERFARGDITEQEYRDRLDVLRQTRAHSDG